MPQPYHHDPPRDPWKITLALAACMALQMTSFVMILPLFARRLSDFGAGVDALGLSALAYALAATFAAPFLGSLADTIGRRPLGVCSPIRDVRRHRCAGAPQRPP